MIIERGTGERFLIPVDEEPSGSAVALLEPWACVEASYASRQRATLAPGGRLLVVADTGHAIEGLAPLLAAAPPAATIAVVADEAQRLALGAIADPAGPGIELKGGLDALALESFGDVIYFGANAEVIEQLQAHLAPRGVIDVVLGGKAIGRPVAVDVGRVHYDLTRWVGTPGRSALDGYAIAPADGELRDDDRVAVIGAAGPMGFMHVVRTATCGRSGIALVAIDIDDARLAHLAGIAAPLAAEHGVRVEFVNGRTTHVEPGFSYVAVMVPAPAIVAQAIELAGEGCRLNLFAGFAVGTRAALDLDALIAKRGYLLGTSGSEIPDMKTVIGKLERGELDTNISVDAITGMEGVTEALAAVEARTSGGKIVVYPALHELGMIRLSELAVRFPTVAAGLRDGRWTRAAEEALLAAAADDGGT
jgi:L-sorbose 1-phosphate reductase